jgi:hypothetical protein
LFHLRYYSPLSVPFIPERICDKEAFCLRQATFLNKKRRLLDFSLPFPA